MKRKSIVFVLVVIGVITLSDAWLLDLERAQRTIEEIDRDEATAKAAFQGKGH